ncbi:MAG TPA: hypothetical protein VNY08_22500 [Bradyrhizobium sp.]|nr:hypothetical protein [Bradyrhizobium sp.]
MDAEASNTTKTKNPRNRMPGNLLDVGNWRIQAQRNRPFGDL